MSLPALLLLVALLSAAVVLASARIALGRTGKRRFAPPRGTAAAGVRYAFTTAFLPWAKESASRHPATYAAGIVYHAGIFAMLALLLLSLASVQPGAPASIALAVLLGLAVLVGLGLLVKRRVDPVLRAISVPDDVVANLLVDLALACGAAALVRPSALPAFQLAGAALLLYLPLGKLRHMVFLVTARRLWGAYYGQRGVVP